MNDNDITELTEDIEVIGPGQMLAEARVRMGLSIEDVAKKLNFRVSLVTDLEKENFAGDVPVTFTRGYLKNYAKLVSVPADEVLASFEMLGVAKKQGAEMQSFSKRTSKQAEHNRIMWLTYLIILVLIGLTVMWWLQESSFTQQDQNSTIDNTQPAKTNDEIELIASQTPVEQAALDTLVQDVMEDATNSDVNPVPESVESVTVTNSSVDEAVNASVATEDATVLTPVQFIFAGDCWVNIFDSTGERIAWGIKKADYVMNIEGVPPFTITLGKPELVAINYDNQPIDMSQFSPGHIAKFELPLK